MNDRVPYPTALTIAGSDCSGGAGIQADLKTFEAFGVFGQSVITAVVAENTVGVEGVLPVTPDFVASQIQCCLDDIGAMAIKTGMLVDAATINAIAEALGHYEVTNLVIDPVMVAKGGDPLVAPEAVKVAVEKLFPLAKVVTPNMPEAEVLVGFPLVSEKDIQKAAEVIHAMGPEVVVIKGGHGPYFEQGIAVDRVWDGNKLTALIYPRHPTKNTHGTGCTFSAAITANLALGHPVLSAIEDAKKYISEAIKNNPNLGTGHGPVLHRLQGWGNLAR